MRGEGGGRGEKEGDEGRRRGKKGRGTLCGTISTTERKEEHTLMVRWRLGGSMPE